MSAGRYKISYLRQYLFVSGNTTVIVFDNSLKSNQVERQIIVVVSDTIQLAERIIGYFKTFEFKLIEEDKNLLKFRQHASLLDTWKTNPLKWGSEIHISLNDNNVIATFHVDTCSQIKTKEEETVWITFIDTFQNYLTYGEISNQKLTATILDSKRSRLSYFSWSILGALTGGLLGLLYNRLTGTTSILSIFLIPVLATFFLRWRLTYVKKKNVI